MDVSRRRYIVHLFIIQLFGCLGWLCNVALALTDLSDSVTGSRNFPDIEIAFIGNLAIFITSLLRGRLDLEMGVRDVLATLRGPKLFPINKDFGLTTCMDQENRFKDASVVMLSYNTPNSSMRQFMKYICNAYKVHSILLQCFPLKIKSAKLLTEKNKSSLLHGICNCVHTAKDKDNKTIECDCIVFWNVEDVIMMLARRMPGRLIRLSDSLCLLPCPHCQETGCHGSKQGQYVEETDESGRKVSTKRDYISGEDIVRGIFDYISENAMEQEHSCICIPLSPSGYDYWTKLLTRSFRATGQANRAYSTASLLLPRLTEVSLNLLLTAWFRVDGFSSSLVARRAIKDYVVDEKGSGFAANAFLTKTRAKENNQCQVLEFRRTILGIKTFSYAVAFVNLICSISWAVLVACQGSFGKWYDWHSIPPSKRRVGVIMIAIGIALGMDFLHLYLSRHSPFNFENQLTAVSKEPTAEPTVSKQSAERNVNTDSKEPTKPTEPTAKVDSKEPTVPTDEGNSEKPAEPTQAVEADSTNPTEPIGKVDSIQPPETKGKADSIQPPVKVWIPPIVKRWFRSVVTILKRIWSCIEGWFRPVATFLKMVWSPLEVCFRPVVTVLKKVSFPLEVWFRPAVRALKMVWSHLKEWFRPVLTVLKNLWSRLKDWWSRLNAWFRPKAGFLYLVNRRPMVWAVIVLEILWIAGLWTMGIKFVGRWVYSALQVLVWIKWITGSYLLGEYPPEYDTQYDYDNGVIVYSSAFLLNSILAGVRGNWSYSLSLES